MLHPSIRASRAIGSADSGPGAGEYEIGRGSHEATCHRIAPCGGCPRGRRHRGRLRTTTTAGRTSGGGGGDVSELKLGVLVPLTGAARRLRRAGLDGREPRGGPAEHRRRGQRALKVTLVTEDTKTDAAGGPGGGDEGHRERRRRGDRRPVGHARADPDGRERHRRRGHPDRDAVGDRPGHHGPRRRRARVPHPAVRRDPGPGAGPGHGARSSARKRRSTPPAATTPTATRPRGGVHRRPGRPAAAPSPRTSPTTRTRPASTPRRSRSPAGDPDGWMIIDYTGTLGEDGPGARAHRQLGPGEDVHRRRPAVARACPTTPARRPPRACAAPCRPPSTRRPAPQFDALWKARGERPAADLRRPELRRGRSCSRSPSPPRARPTARTSPGTCRTSPGRPGRSTRSSSSPRRSPRCRTARTSTTRAPRARSTSTRTATRPRPTTARGATRAASWSTTTTVIPVTEAD